MPSKGSNHYNIMGKRVNGQGAPTACTDAVFEACLLAYLKPGSRKSDWKAAIRAAVGRDLSHQKCEQVITAVRKFATENTRERLEAYLDQTVEFHARVVNDELDGEKCRVVDRLAAARELNRIAGAHAPARVEKKTEVTHRKAEPKPAFDADGFRREVDQHVDARIKALADQARAAAADGATVGGRLGAAVRAGANADGGN